MMAGIIRENAQLDKAEAIREWQEEYQLILQNPPVEGDYISAIDNGMIRVTVLCEEGKRPFVFTRMAVPEIVGIPPAYYGQSMGDTSNKGWKVIISPQSKDEVFRQCTIMHDEYGSYVLVRRLEILHRSVSGNSFLADVIDWK